MHALGRMLQRIRDIARYGERAPHADHIDVFGLLQHRHGSVERLIVKRRVELIEPIPARDDEFARAGPLRQAPGLVVDELSNALLVSLPGRILSPITLLEGFL